MPNANAQKVARVESFMGNAETARPVIDINHILVYVEPVWMISKPGLYPGTFDSAMGCPERGVNAQELHVLRILVFPQMLKYVHCNRRRCH